MALKKISSNKWAVKVSVWDKNKKYPISKQTTVTGTRSDAAIVEADLLKELRARSLTSAHASTFGEAVDLYAQKLRLQGKLSTRHERMVGFVRRELGHIRLEAFADRFEVYRKHLILDPTVYGKVRKGASVNRYTSIVRAVFGHLVDLEAIDKNPITAVRFPKLGEKPRDRYLTQEERLKLLNAIRERRPYILPIIQYMLAVPCRLGELLLARREQYSPITNTVYIPDSKAGIPIYKPVPEEMREYFMSIPYDCPWLFYQRVVRLSKTIYRPLTHLRYAWNVCLKQAGITDMRIHDLRHIAATDLYAAGNSERRIMGVAGWKTPMLSNYRNKNSLRDAQETTFRPSAVQQNHSEITMKYVI
jgi:integrase